MNSPYAIAFQGPDERCPRIFIPYLQQRSLHQSSLDDALLYLRAKSCLGRLFGTVVIYEGFIAEVHYSKSPFWLMLTFRAVKRSSTLEGRT